MSILQIRLDRVTIEVMCRPTDLCDILIKSEGVISKNVFYIGRPPGGAMKGRCEKCRAKVFPWPLGSTHTKSYTDRCSYTSKH